MPPPVQFPAVQTILQTLIANWTAGNGGVAPNLVGPRTHNTPMFAWDTLADLLNSSARGDPLIQPATIGKAGQGHTANLVVALTTGVGAFPPMPDGGLDSTNNIYLAPGSPEITTIINWIEGGCLP